MSKLREALRPFLGKRIKVRGKLSLMKDDPKGIRACIQDPEMNGIIFSDHIWVMGCLQWLPHRNAKGIEVEFRAVVNRYDKPDGSWNFGLWKPAKLMLIRPPILAIPEVRSNARDR